jgi:hypothetical protein
MSRSLACLPDALEEHQEALVVQRETQSTKLKERPRMVAKAHAAHHVEPLGALHEDPD